LKQFLKSVNIDEVTGRIVDFLKWPVRRVTVLLKDEELA